MKTLVESPVRRITEAEAQTFQRDGWVFLPEFVNLEIVAQMRSFLEEHLGVDGQATLSPKWQARTRFVESGFWRDWRFLGRDAAVEPFRTFCLASHLGENANRALGRDVSIRMDVDGVLLKPPVGTPLGSTPTEWHQDWPNLSHDRVGYTTFWSALTEVPPERGGLRFLTGSQREGPLGRTLRGGLDLVSQYPHLVDRYDISPALHYRPGDATIHNGLIVHCAPPNTTDEPRWAYSVGVFPGDVRYNGATFSNTDGLGLEPGQLLDTDHFPLIFDPQA